MSPPLALLKVAQRQSATDQVFTALYDSVVSLALPPGTKVSEAEIAKQLGVSRQPVRDAFFRLTKMGFLAIRPQRATLVTRISETAVRDAVFVRIALEVECLRAALPRIAERDLDVLRDGLGRQEAALDDADPAVFHSLDEEFHAALCAMAGHSHAWTLILEQKAHMDRVRYLTLSSTRRRQVLGEHGAVVDALAARDLPEAEAALRRHLTDITRGLPGLRAKHPEFFEPPG